jgi:ABC-type transport system involved in cytochrome bd biosynthesis fused ATPase/permease subunit
MAIRSFVVGPVRGLRHAAAGDLPNLVVVAGPNGAGKSTLLDQLRKRATEFAEAGTEVTYLGPHRSWRKATLGGAHLHQMPYTFRQYLGMPQLPGWKQVAPPGLQYIQAVGERSAESSDEAFSLLLQRVFEEQGGQVSPGTMPHVFAHQSHLSEAPSRLHARH